MARIDSQLLFLTTSPRTPEKMIPELELLVKHFEGKVWNQECQRAFMEVLRDEDFFNGQGMKDPAFSARDRINRAPKSLGFVQLKPTVRLTPAGSSLLSSRRKDEVFLRQMLKFQIPSPFHKPTDKAAAFCVKPFLEILRLVRRMGTLKFDELQIFGMQLTDYHNFETVVCKIEKFRIAKAKHQGSYRAFKTAYLFDELRDIYQERISRGDTKTRESTDASLAKFLKTQSSNMRDYADACFRYLRCTGLVNVSHIGKSLSIVTEKIADVDYILQHVGRDPVFVDDTFAYETYLGDIQQPLLLSDDRMLLKRNIQQQFPDYMIPKSASLDELKDLLADLLEQRKVNIISAQVAAIKDYQKYDEIQGIYDQIEANMLYDAPLMLEWNTWRAMTMLDGGNIKANLNFGDDGYPLSAAAGNMADIVCDYGDFMVCVEVTMAVGQKQYEMEGEPVTRHLGRMKKMSGKPCYCLFIAPKINEACVAHFYTLHHLHLSIYGGKSNIIPLPLKIFRKMIEDSFNAGFIPNPSHVRRFFEFSAQCAMTCKDEEEWFGKIEEKAVHWLE